VLDLRGRSLATRLEVHRRWDRERPFEALRLSIVVASSRAHGAIRRAALCTSRFTLELPHHLPDAELAKG
jgi:hypothetical protein